MPDDYPQESYHCPYCSALFFPHQIQEHLRFAHPLPRVKEDTRRIKFDDRATRLPGFAPADPLPKGR